MSPMMTLAPPILKVAGDVAFCPKLRVELTNCGTPVMSPPLKLNVAVVMLNVDAPAFNAPPS